MVPLFLFAILVPLIDAQIIQTTPTIRPCCYPQQWQAVIKDIGRDNVLSTNKTEEYDVSKPPRMCDGD